MDLGSSICIFAQAPDAFNYQAVLRNSDGSAQTDKAVELDLAILQGSATGSVVYDESHSTTTSNIGLVNLQIGGGSVTSGTFASIDWANGPYFVRVTVDGTEMGTSQLLSVPYAKHAETAETAENVPTKVSELTNDAGYVTDVPTKVSDLTNDEGYIKTEEDGDATNELITSFVLNGTNLEITDASGTKIVDLSALLTPVPTTITDLRDAQVYDIVKIGNQTWMADNLNYDTGTGSFYYGNNQVTYEVPYGRLYTYDAAQDACPTGWHLPNEGDWNELITYLGGTSVAGGKLKATGTFYWNSPNTCATNETGFTALPGGGLQVPTAV